jgi:phosphoribosyl 1,2-cyclic phosphodiesterase
MARFVMSQRRSRGPLPASPEVRRLAAAGPPHPGAGRAGAIRPGVVRQPGRKPSHSTPAPLARWLLFEPVMEERMDQLTVRFWGVRGSVAASGLEYAGTGGNTACVEVRAGDQLLVFDAGTGLVGLGRTLPPGVTVHLFLSHLHWDHIQGFPFFAPAWTRGSTVVVHGPGTAADLRAALSLQMTAPEFPVPLSAMGGTIEFRGLSPGEWVVLGRTTVEAAALNHPQGCLGYRVTSPGGRSLVYATDTEPEAGAELDAGVVRLARGADLLVHDAQYTDGEYLGQGGPSRVGWGHTPLGAACRNAAEAGVGRLLLFHHDPARDDRGVAALEQAARGRFPAATAAREGLVLAA